MKESFTGHIPLLTTFSTYELGRRLTLELEFFSACDLHIFSIPTNNYWLLLIIITNNRNVNNK